MAKSKHILVCSLAMLLCLAAEADVPSPPPRKDWLYHVRVRIFNKLGGNCAPLKVHCKSSDDDLGVQNIYNDQEYGFSFRVNMFGTTKFRCEMWWANNGRVLMMQFAAFNGLKDGERCQSECTWQIKTDGAYNLNQVTGKWDLRSTWFD